MKLNFLIIAALKIVIASTCVPNDYCSHTVGLGSVCETATGICRGSTVNNCLSCGPVKDGKLVGHQSSVTSAQPAKNAAPTATSRVHIGTKTLLHSSTVRPSTSTKSPFSSVPVTTRIPVSTKTIISYSGTTKEKNSSRDSTAGSTKPSSSAAPVVPTSSPDRKTTIPLNSTAVKKN